MLQLSISYHQMRNFRARNGLHLIELIKEAPWNLPTNSGYFAMAIVCAL